MELDGAWLGVRAGPVTHHGAHAHSDQMSFVLAVSGSDLLVDPGTGVYSADPKKRNRYRSSRAHNACYINDWEANSFAEGKAGLFAMGDDTRTEVREFSSSPESASILCRHFGYERFRSGVIHDRELVLRSGCLEIRDRFYGLQAGDQVEWMFHFGPEARAGMVHESIKVFLSSSAVEFIPDHRVESRLAKSRISPAYGREDRVDALLLSAQVAGSGIAEYHSWIKWGDADFDPGKAERLKMGDSDSRI